MKVNKGVLWLFIVFCLFKSGAAIAFTLSASTPDSNGNFTLTWTPPTNGNTYYLGYQQSTTTSQDTGVYGGYARTVSLNRPVGTYYFYVRAMGRAPTVQTSTVKVVVPAPLPPKVTGLVASNNLGTVNLRWNASSNATTYVLSYGKNGSYSKSLAIYGNVTPPTNKTIVFAAPADKGNWSFRVRACNSTNQCSSESSPVIVLVDLHVPSACQNGSVLSSTNASITYSYDALGRLTKVLDSRNCDRDYEYDAAGNRKVVKERAQ
ncbi:MAG: RHS repeat protein [Chromatiaceae bacterium]|nr:RHS repeat protein [Chromatiaceae bacterium]